MNLWWFECRGQSARGLAQSKTLRVGDEGRISRAATALREGHAGLNARVAEDAKGRGEKVEL
jgi:hypothetical protein